MAHIHSADIEHFDFLEFDHKHAVAKTRLDFWTKFHESLGDDMHPALTAALQELYRSCPEGEKRVVHWGDAKPGNMIFAGGQVQAVLDWELCGLSAREEDLSHWFAVDWFLSSGIGIPRIRNLPGKAESMATYQDVAQVDLFKMNWWFSFALVRMGCIFQRAAVQARTNKADALRKNAIIQHLDGIVSDAIWVEYASHDSA